MVNVNLNNIIIGLAITVKHRWSGILCMFVLSNRYAVEIFKYFEEKTKTDIRVKFGTEAEDAFVEILKELFPMIKSICLMKNLLE